MKFNFHGKTQKQRKTNQQKPCKWWESGKQSHLVSALWMFYSYQLTASYCITRNQIYCTLMSCFFSFHVTLGLYIFLFQGNISPRLLPGNKKKKNEKYHHHNNNNNNWTSPLPDLTGCPGPSWHNKICAIETHSMQPPHFSSDSVIQNIL